MKPEQTTENLLVCSCSFERHILTVGRLCLECGSIFCLFPHKDFFVFAGTLPSFLTFFIYHYVACRLLIALLKLCCQTGLLYPLSRLINQRLMEEQSQVEELQKTLQEQGSKADDVSN